MKNFCCSEIVAEICSKYPKNKYGSACALFDGVGNIITKKLQSDKDFTQVLQGFLDLGFKDVDFSISITLDNCALHFEQSMVRGVK